MVEGNHKIGLDLRKERGNRKVQIANHLAKEECDILGRQQMGSLGWLGDLERMVLDILKVA